MSLYMSSGFKSTSFLRKSSTSSLEMGLRSGSHWSKTDSLTKSGEDARSASYLRGVAISSVARARTGLPMLRRTTSITSSV